MNHVADTSAGKASFSTERIGDATVAISTLARLHGVVDEREPIDDFVNAAARLSDSEVSFDRIERLLVALQRAGVINDQEGLALHVAYLRQRAATASQTETRPVASPTG